MNDTNSTVLKQQKVFNYDKLRYVKSVVLFKPLTILKREFRPILREKFIKDFLN